MIKKLTQTLLALALVGGMTACDKSMKGVDEGTTSATGDTYMSVAFSTANPNSTRAEDKNFNSIGEYIGRDEIKNVNVYVINLPEETVELNEVNIVTKNPDNDANTKDFRTEAWKTTAGDKIIYVYVNIKGTKIADALNAATSKTAFEKAAKDAYSLTENGVVLEGIAKYNKTDDKDIIAMAPIEPKTLNVKAGVTKDDAEAKNKPFAQAKNCVQVSVRRLVAQAAVTASADKFEIKEGADVLVTFDKLQWDVMQFEQTTFLAPQPVKADAEPAQNPMLTQFCKSPSFDFITTDANYTTDAGAKYAYRAFTGEPVATFTRSTNTDAVEKNKEDVANIVKNPMKFITETTHQFGDKLEADGGTAPFTGYRKGNTTYVIIAAQITPQGNALAEGQTYTAGNDLFYGVQDKKFYADKATAQANNAPSVAFTDGRDNVIKYAKGICYYVAWLNPDNATDPVKSPILRNNIYHVNIKAIKKLGYSGNPFDPTNKTPKDPDDKTPDPKETLYPIDTYMSVEISVVNWGVHSYDHEF